ncbi:two pore domain potassium channel family protein, partial [Candidatus Woesearchaeota archaeon]|nr:two pore domain potassium channel family protein [Candidatus Woesearchaeota archaeon]
MISSRFGFVALLLIIVLVTGTVGYYNIEGYSALDSLYMTVITVSTVGFQEVYPLSAEGKIFTMVLILGGVGIVVFAVGMFSEWLVNNATRMNQ